MVGEELHALRNTVVTLGTGPGVFWTTGALRGVLTRRKSLKRESLVKYCPKDNLHCYIIQSYRAAGNVCFTIRFCLQLYPRHKGQQPIRIGGGDKLHQPIKDNETSQMTPPTSLYDRWLMSYSQIKFRPIRRRGGAKLNQLR